MSHIIQATTPSDAFLVLSNVSTSEPMVFNGMASKHEGSKPSRAPAHKAFRAE